MKNNKTIKVNSPNLKPAITATATAAVLMLLFGLAFHGLAIQIAAPTDSTPIDPCALNQFPLQIGEWTGIDIPMDEEIIRATDTDATLKRQYSRQNGFQSVSFYIACGVRARDLMPHRPEVCYTGSGWTLTDSQTLQMSDTLSGNLMQFAGGSLGSQKVMVLYYYIVDGQFTQDVSHLRSKIWRGSGAVGYVAQIQITAPVTPTLTPETAEKMISDFAIASAQPTADLFRNIKNKENTDEHPKSP